MSRLTATERLARLLAIIPWVAAQESAAIDEIGSRFDYPRDELLRDLDEVVFMVGVYPFTPDMLIEVEVIDDRVAIRYADWFSRPMRLTAEQRVALVVAGTALVSRARDESEAGPLLRALAKLELSNPGDATVDVHLESGVEGTIGVLQQAINERCAVEIDHYSLGRDERTNRVIEPWRVFSTDGHWYVAAWCRLAGAERTFRIDRIRAASTIAGDRTVLPEIGELPSADVLSTVTDPSMPRIVIDVAPDVSWVAGAYPFDQLERRPDGRLRVTLPVAGEIWLQRLLIRLGADAVVVQAPPGFDRLSLEPVLRRILGRYATDPAR